jgi:hypothetical protein
MSNAYKLFSIKTLSYVVVIVIVLGVILLNINGIAEFVFSQVYKYIVLPALGSYTALISLIDADKTESKRSVTFCESNTFIKSYENNIFINVYGFYIWYNISLIIDEIFIINIVLLSIPIIIGVFIIVWCIKGILSNMNDAKNLTTTLLIKPFLVYLALIVTIQDRPFSGSDYYGINDDYERYEYIEEPDWDESKYNYAFSNKIKVLEFRKLKFIEHSGIGNFEVIRGSYYIESIDMKYNTIVFKNEKFEYSGKYQIRVDANGGLWYIRFDG